MAKFTAAVPLNIKWNGLDIEGAVDATYRIPDAYVEEFIDGPGRHIAGLTWITQDETSAIPTLPIGQTDVTGLTASLASLSSSLAGKFDKAGGIISGAVTATGSVNAGALRVNGGGFANSFDNDVWIAGSVRSAATGPTQGYYGQHRISGNAGSAVHDAGAFEIRLNGISNASFLNAFEATSVITGGTNTIPDTRAITANVTLNSGAGGTVTKIPVIVAQAVVNASSASIGTVYGIYAEPQTAGTTNYSIYAPTGTTLLGVVQTEGDVTVGINGTGARIVNINGAAGNAREIRINTGTSLRWILRVNSTAETGSNAGSDFELLARTDAGGTNVTPVSIRRSNGAISIANVPIGFFGATAASKQTVSGSHGGNAALQSLLSALATYGLIVNSTTT